MRCSAAQTAPSRCLAVFLPAVLRPAANGGARRDGLLFLALLTMSNATTYQHQDCLRPRGSRMDVFLVARVKSIFAVSLVDSANTHIIALYLEVLWYYGTLVYDKSTRAHPPGIFPVWLSRKWEQETKSAEFQILIKSRWDSPTKVTRQ